MNKRTEAVNKIAAENNQLRKQLTKANRDYYEDLLVYMRGKNLFRDDYQLEESLLGILQDLIDAQNDGTDAMTYFGHDPKQTATELLKSIPLRIGNFIWFNLKLAAMMIFILWLPRLTYPNVTFDAGSLLLASGIAIVSAWGGLWYVGSHAFAKPSRLQLTAIIILGVILFGIMVSILLFLKTSWQIRLSAHTSFTVIILGLVIAAILPFVHHLTELERPIYYFSLFILILGLLVYLRATRSFFRTKIDFGKWQWLLYVFIILSGVGIGVLIWWLGERRHHH
ncbi:MULTISPECIES: hypothetical protein [Lacticaseibacillus]|uniref:DUF1129 family protein n=2 Tax=Lacticaseibacillus TaxID=2759736 RepID=A0AAN1EZ95_LACCA|nr:MULTISPECIES: hypothetical protein [Lacticaseibacillus]ARY91895.1 hypothetical protein BGL52_09080 [Lacticaseibacillus casei]KAB1970942.1 hypothetical protein F9B82_00165 [Lacticaseibacillus casei]WLV79797.1 hypothetical protein LACSTY_001827 [Lacticaseibacillus sp. NCIMB 15473]WNX23757.1 hypothetical protein RWA15_08845 [Lacticaseibacillus casei]WNX26532.1 hypothetical protein RWA16_08850 [Lacticaseibacillus casei]